MRGVDRELTFGGSVLSCVDCIDVSTQLDFVGVDWCVRWGDDQCLV